MCLRKFPYQIHLFVILASLSSANSEDDLAYLQYQIPVSAMARGPLPSRSGERVFKYVAEDGSVVGQRSFIKSKEIKRSVFYKGKKHGVQREWHLDGTSKTAAPFKFGIMHGMFQHWDESGNLVGSYEMSRGNGRRKIFHSNGKLRLVKDFKDNAQDGIHFEFHDNGVPTTMIWTRHGKRVGFSAAFYRDGSIRSIGHYDSDGRLHGQVIKWSEEGVIEFDFFYVNGIEISRVAYKGLVEEGKFGQIWKSRQDVTELDYKAAIKKYQDLKPVDIPLLFHTD